MTAVVANRHWGPPARAGAFDTTSQPSGAVTANENVAFRSGWSKHGYTRWASKDSNWE